MLARHVFGNKNITKTSLLNDLHAVDSQSTDAIYAWVKSLTVAFSLCRVSRSQRSTLLPKVRLCEVFSVGAAGNSVSAVVLCCVCMADVFVWSNEMYVHRPQGRDHTAFLENDLGAEILHHRHGDSLRGREQGKWMRASTLHHLVHGNALAIWRNTFMCIQFAPVASTCFFHICSGNRNRGHTYNFSLTALFLFSGDVEQMCSVLAIHGERNGDLRRLCVKN